MHRLLTRLFPSAPTLLLQVLVICTMTTDYISPPAHYSGLIRFVALVGLPKPLVYYNLYDTNCSLSSSYYSV